ncbi:tyrosine-protein phosphatase [Butyrivibrio sp. XBB1001]|uniref:tyrosine-protein phosphatase n=1 Tax=Butyrivibrio sp. XBB1001 TaxID=1280682 RepID=UPI000415AA43|nr:CpsB/CapC family capsule biosynthesis tyrosine phosphatase [Butyrivibrio sp. XBB1001]
MIDFGKPVIGLTDIHCHIVPFVDDGAEDYEEAQELIRREYSQGVRTLVMTVHLRKGMFDTPTSKAVKHFDELKRWLAETDMSDMEIFLSREYYCDERFETLLEGYANNSEEVFFDGEKLVPRDEIRPFGKQKCILLEFSSSRMQDSEFEIFIKKASQAGLTPIVAHAERCPAVQDRPTIVYRMKEQGALIQVNCESLLSKTGTKEFQTAHGLVKHKLADIVSSDCHNLKERQPEVRKSYLFLKKKYGISVADELMRERAVSLIYGDEVGNCKELFVNVKN